MPREDAEWAVVQLDLLLSQLEAHRDDATRYAALAEQVTGHFELISELVDSGDPRLADLDRRLMREFVFAAKSAHLRMPAALDSGALGSAILGKSGY